MDVKTAIPIVMGANIGTSMTSTIVALSYIASASQFERAFSAATVHDCFNWLAVIIMLIIEVTTGFLFHLTDQIAGAHESKNSTSNEKVKVPNFLKKITHPLTDKVLQVKKKDSSIIRNLYIIIIENCRLIRRS